MQNDKRFINKYNKYNKYNQFVDGIHIQKF